MRVPGKKEVHQGVVIFLHLPKAAGSTFTRILERQYGRDKVLKLYDSFFGEEIADLPAERLENLKAVTGHLYFGAHTFLTHPATYITFLRDPVNRVISHYHYVRRDPSHYLYNAAQELTLREYVTHCGKCEPNNDQTRLLAGREYFLEDGTWNEEMFPAAQKNLREHFSVVGLVEEYDRSLILMKRTLDWRMPYYVRQNVSRRIDASEIDPETVRVIQAFNELDAELHAFGKRILEEQVLLLGESLQRELRLFEALNAVYGGLNAFTRMVSGQA